jgi:hypothetical protein
MTIREFLIILGIAVLVAMTMMDLLLVSVGELDEWTTFFRVKLGFQMIIFAGFIAAITKK